MNELIALSLNNTLSTCIYNIPR